MKYWLINLWSKNILVDDTRKISTIKIRSKRRVRIQRTDQLLIHEAGDTLFRFVFKAIDITREESDDLFSEVIAGFSRLSLPTDTLENVESPSPTYIYTVSVEAIGEIESEVTLDDLKYSLGFVRRMDRPSMHFRQPYRQVQRTDFETIREGRVFWSRTGFYSLFNALPTALRLQFAYEEALDTGVRNGAGYLGRLRQVSDFVRRNVLSAGQLLVAAEDRWRRLHGGAPPVAFEHVHFSTDDGLPGDSAGIQLQRFLDLFQVLESDSDEMDLIHQLDRVATSEAQVGAERILEQYFSRL